MRGTAFPALMVDFAGRVSTVLLNLFLSFLASLSISPLLRSLLYSHLNCRLLYFITTPITTSGELPSSVITLPSHPFICPFSLYVCSLENLNSWNLPVFFSLGSSTGTQHRSGSWLFSKSMLKKLRKIIRATNYSMYSSALHLSIAP